MILGKGDIVEGRRAVVGVSGGKKGGYPAAEDPSPKVIRKLDHGGQEGRGWLSMVAS